MPRATVVIPTYNWSSVLRWSVASVLRQTMRDFELLVVGDACTDDSADVVASFGDPRVRWINLAENVGEQSGPNNEGIRQAQSPVVAYLGHDDLYLPHHLAVMCAAIDAGADVAHGIVTAIHPDGTCSPGAACPGPYDGADFIVPSAVVHRTELAHRLGGWRAARDLVGTNPDTDFWRRLHASGCRWQYVPRLLAVKFPAIDRRNSYREKPSHEQEAWTRRIETEPDFEAVELARLLECQHRKARRPVGVRDNARALARAVGDSLRTRVESARERRRKKLPGEDIDRRRAFKGLEPKPRDDEE